jgi:leucyl aminopeptidase
MKFSFEFSPAKPFKKDASFDARIRRVVFLTGTTLPKDFLAALPATLVERLNEEAKRLHDKPASPNELPEALSLKIALTEGGFIQALWYPAELEAFEVHEALRKHLEAEFKKSGPLLVDLGRLTPPRQAKALEWIASLSVVAQFERTVFGRRAAKAKAEAPIPVAASVVSKLTPAAFRQAVDHGRRLGEANNFVRTLAELPGNELNPVAYRKKLESYAKAEKNVSLKYLGVDELKKRSAGAFLAVVKADPDTASGIAHLSYKPAGAKKRVVFVGKGLCFDTGGYNIKTGNYMNGMHRDMTGSAVAWALFRLVRELQPKLEVHAVLGIAENLISPTGYRPNDVVVASDGTSIEVVDTDAEGRMVLADTLLYAAGLEPDLMFDFATLTGAAVRSLDTRRGAVFSNRDALAKTAVEVGEDCGERTWSFPLSRDYRRALKSDVADILQCGPGSNADHIYAATFLRHFAGEKAPWLHLDLSCEINKGGLGLVSTDSTGYGVRWAYAAARRILALS